MCELEPNRSGNGCIINTWFWCCIIPLYKITLSFRIVSWTFQLDLQYSLRKCLRPNLYFCRSSHWIWMLFCGSHRQVLTNCYLVWCRQNCHQLICCSFGRLILAFRLKLEMNFSWTFYLRIGRVKESTNILWKFGRNSTI